MATIDEIFEMWGKDCELDETNIIGESANISKLHHKYHTLLTQESLRLFKLKEDMKVLKVDKTRYYSGAMDVLECKQKGWEPNQLKIIRQDVGMYVEADKDIIELSLKIGIADQKVKYLEDVIKNIHSRSFQIKNIQEWARFQSGSM